MMTSDGQAPGDFAGAVLVFYACDGAIKESQQILTPIHLETRFFLGGEFF